MNLKMLLDNAHSFKIAAYRCLEERETGINTYEMPMFPAVINLSFSAELYIKYILLKNNIKHKNTHNLKDLYLKLPDNHKSYVIGCMYLTYKNEKEFDFLGKLEKHSNLFYDWRYAHEKINTKKIMECDYVFLQNIIKQISVLAHND